MSQDSAAPAAAVEGANFWEGVRTRRVTDGRAGPWLDGVAAVVQPALVEDIPRALLAALVAGVPVVATAACGLGRREGVYEVPFGDAEALCGVLARAIPGLRAES